MRAALYARYSDDLQRPASIVDQVALCRRVAEQIGAEVVEIYTDAAISGFASANRPGLLALLEAAHRRQFDVVIAEAIDRLSRGGSGAWSIYEDMQTLGIEIVTAEEQTVDEMKVGSKAMFSAMFLK
ncbi:MAG TPA: recombinase family protein, partial [Caulobacteraceae bacterium]